MKINLERRALILAPDRMRVRTKPKPKQLPGNKFETDEIRKLI